MNRIKSPQKNVMVSTSGVENLQVVRDCVFYSPIGYDDINPLNPELNPICYLLALLAHHFLHVSRIRVKSLTIRLLMSYIYIIYICVYIYIYVYIWSTFS